MTEPRSLSRRDEALLVQLADGALDGPAHARADARARAIPQAELLIARQRRVARALGDDTPQVAMAVKERRRVEWLAPALAIAAALLMLVVLTPGGERTTIQRAADLAQAGPTQPPPGSTGTLLRAQVDGVHFPDWSRSFGWQETGMRHDVLDERRSTTVFYEHTGHRLAYTIVSGAPLPRPENVRVVRRVGLDIALYRDPGHGGHDVAVFERGGRTCVIAGHVRELDTLLELAAWTGDGRLRS